MPIDPSIIMQASKRDWSLADIMRNAEAIAASKQLREARAFEMEQEREKAAREQRANASLADLVLADPRNNPFGETRTVATGGTPFAEAFNPQAMSAIETGGQAPAATAPTLSEQLVNPQGAAAWEKYVRENPRGALDYRKETQSWQADHFKLANDLNNGVLRILGGVNDQTSYDRGKEQARRLYGQYGVNLDDFNLPEEYSPDVIQGLRMQAVDTAKQMSAIRAERKLDWDIEDDTLDNKRADRNTDDLISDRATRREETRRWHNQSDATRRRGQDMRPPPGSRSSGYRESIVSVKTPEEAAKLAPGTKFRTPDGRIKIR